MELNVLEKSKKKIVVEIKGEDYTFCNILKEELWKDKHVKAAALKIEHPLIGIPTLLVETDGKEAPEKALEEAAMRLKKLSAGFYKEFTKKIK